MPRFYAIKNDADFTWNHWASALASDSSDNRPVALITKALVERGDPAPRGFIGKCLASTVMGAKEGSTPRAKCEFADRDCPRTAFRVAQARDNGLPLEKEDLAILQAAVRQKTSDSSRLIVLAEIARFSGADSLVFKDADAIRPIIAANKEWKRTVGSEPPMGLSGYSAHGFDPNCFATVRGVVMDPFLRYVIDSRGIDTTDFDVQRNLAAYRLTRLLGTPERVQEYVEKTSPERESENSLIRKGHAYGYAANFMLPSHSDWDPTAWGNAALEMGKIVPAVLPLCRKGEMPPATRSAMADRFADSYYGGDPSDRCAALRRACLLQNIDRPAQRECAEATERSDFAGTGSRVPSVQIDGEEIGRPGYVFRKVHAADPRVFLAGQMIDSSSGFTGAGWLSNAAAAAASPDIGTFVLEKKDADPCDASAIDFACLGIIDEKNRMCFNCMVPFRGEEEQPRFEMARFALALRARLKDAPGISHVHLASDERKILPLQKVKHQDISLRARGLLLSNYSLRQYDIIGGTPTLDQGIQRKLEEACTAPDRRMQASKFEDMKKATDAMAMAVSCANIQDTTLA